MFTYGSQVNPALLRQDFSAIMQGAQARAQGIAQGAQIRGQAMANLGAQVGSTMSELGKAYIKSREDNSILEAKNSAILSQNPEIAKLPEVQKFNEKRAKSGGLSLNDNTKLNALLTTSTEQARLRQEQEARSLAMEANKFQLDAAKAAKDRADRDRVAMSQIWAEAGKTGKIPDQDDTIRLGLYYGLSPEGIASMLGVSQNSIEFGAKMAQTAAVVEKLKAENTEVAARNDRINQALKLMPNGFREYDDGKTKVFQYIDYASGQVKSEMLKAGQVPASIQQLKVKQEDMTKLVTEYQQLMASPQRDSQENVKRRELLTQQYNLILPNADVGRSNMTRTELDKMFGFQSVLTKTGTEAAKPPPPTPSNIRGVSAAAPGAQPTPAAAPAAAVPTAAAAQGGFNLIEDMRRTFAGRAQAAPVTTPAVDTTVATPTPAAPPPVDLSAPPSIAAAVRFGDTPPPNPTPAVERALKSAMRWADKNLGPKGKLGLGAMAESLSKPAFEAAREQELRLAQELSEKSDTPVKTFNEAMTNFGYRKSGGGQWEYKGPAFRAGTGSGSEETWMRGRIPDALIPSFLSPSPGADFGGAQPAASAAGSGFEPNVFARAGMALYNSLPSRTQESRFLDREARATVAAMRPEMETPLPFERYQTPNQGPVPQIKLSPAAQKIASELRRSAQSGERGKAPQFFLEASTGDDGKRTRIKLSKQDLDLFLSRTPDLRGEVRMGAEFQPFSQSYGQQLRQFRAR